MDISLSKLWELVMDRKAWHATVHGVTKSLTWPSDWTNCTRLQPSRLLCPWDFPGKNTRVSCHALLQGIFPTQGSIASLLHLLLWQMSSLPMVKNLPAMQELQEMWVLSKGQKVSWWRAWQPTPVFLPGKSYGQRNLAGYKGAQVFWAYFCG